jgi:hypothetical protein
MKSVDRSEYLLANDEIRIDNPLLHWRPSEVDRKARQFARDYELRNQEDHFVKAARILRDPEAWQSVPNLTADEKQALETERSNGFWQQPKELKVTVRLTSIAMQSGVCRLTRLQIITLCVAAVVQGWNQTVSLHCSFHLHRPH